MADNDFIGFQNIPVFELPIDIEEFVDLSTGRMKAPEGVTGMTLKEAAIYAADWWERKARFLMPDYVKRRGNDYIEKFGTRSGILLGLEWERLEKDEKLKVIRQWWDKVGVYKHGYGMGSSMDGKEFLS